jgi:hypothetical protein
MCDNIISLYHLDKFLLYNCASLWLQTRSSLKRYTLRNFFIIDGQNYTLPRYTRGDYK